MTTLTTTRPYTPSGRQQTDPLPLNDLDRAGRAVIETIGARRAVRDALSCLAPKEIAQLTMLVADNDSPGLRRRLRQIAAGSLRAAISDTRHADRLGKAIAAKTIELAGTRELALAVLPRELAAAAPRPRRHRPDHAITLVALASTTPRELRRYAHDGHLTTKARFVPAIA